MSDDTFEPKPKSLRGFAHMKLHNPKRLTEIAQRAGVLAHVKGNAHEWTREEARQAGRIGGVIRRGGRGKAKE